MMRAAQYVPGGPEGLSVGEVPIPGLREREVLLEVYASAVNRADTLQRRGTYPVPAGESQILGLEAVGIVHKLGPNASKWKIGDRVMALISGGGYAEFVAAHEDHLLPVAMEMTFSQAAAIPEVWLTAFQLLHLVGKVERGDIVLIHAGGSGVGTAAVQLALTAGATAVVTAGSQGKIDKAKSLGAAAGFNYKEDNFAEKVMEFTKGHGVDVILDCVGGSFWEQNAASIAVDGRWVQYGLMGGGNVNGDLLAKILRKRITITGSLLRSRTIEYKAALVAAFSRDALPHFVSGKYQTIVHTTFPLDQVADAHRMVEANQNTGKIIITVKEEEGLSGHKEL